MKERLLTSIEQAAQEQVPVTQVTLTLLQQDNSEPPTRLVQTVVDLVENLVDQVFGNTPEEESRLDPSIQMQLTTRSRSAQELLALLS